MKGCFNFCLIFGLLILALGHLFGQAIDFSLLESEGKEVKMEWGQCKTKVSDKWVTCSKHLLEMYGE